MKKSDLALSTAPPRREKEWQKVKRLHKYLHPVCEVCGKKPVVVHHMIPYQVEPKLELDPGNLITLCHRCHLYIGHLDQYSSWNPDIKNDVEFFKKKFKHRPKWGAKK